jgi:hypothetical protein
MDNLPDHATTVLLLLLALLAVFGIALRSFA